MIANERGREREGREKKKKKRKERGGCHSNNKATPTNLMQGYRFIDDTIKLARVHCWVGVVRVTISNKRKNIINDLKTAKIRITCTMSIKIISPNFKLTNLQNLFPIKYRQKKSIIE